MESNTAPKRVKSGGTQISRRTVARGLAWSAPIAAVGVAAPAFASSCKAEIEIGPGSCKCPGNSTDGQLKSYFLKFCIKDSKACGATVGTKFTVTKVVNSSGRNLVKGILNNNCDYPGLPISGTVGDGVPADEGCTAVVRLQALDEDNPSSATPLFVTFNFEGQPSQTFRTNTVVRDCGTKQEPDVRCTSCG